MAEMKHTPEPWSTVSDPVMGTLIRQEGLILAKMRELGGIDHQANAARIVECVNALAGIEHPEQFVANALQNAGRLLELSNECDVLKSDLRDILEAFETLILAIPVGNPTQDMLNAIAQVRKENNL